MLGFYIGSINTKLIKKTIMLTIIYSASKITAIPICPYGAILWLPQGITTVMLSSRACPLKATQKLQLVHNSAAQLLLGAK